MLGCAGDCDGVRVTTRSEPSLVLIKEAIVAAGLEVFRMLPDEIQLAERVRFHMMDSGVRVVVDRTAVAEASLGLRVRFVVRAQQSDFPNASVAQLVELVRSKVGAQSKARSYVEAESNSVDVRSPSDASTILDVWHEVTYEKSSASVAELLSELRWALGVPKQITP